MDSVGPPQRKGPLGVANDSARRSKVGLGASLGIAGWTAATTTMTWVAALTLAGCVHVPPDGRAAYRLAKYFESHSETPPSAAEEMRRGHVTFGMDEEQVFAVLGEPVRRIRHAGDGAPEVWLYPGHKIHQGYAHGATLYRLVFLDGRLRLLEPI